MDEFKGKSFWVGKKPLTQQDYYVPRKKAKTGTW